ncbi:amidohydrolase [Pseudoalteromonas sp. BSi20480]|nr:amidohydrolase [Pseudoalteromonas sp. BSi20480]
MKKSLLSVVLGFAALGTFNAQANLDQHVKNVEQQVIEWRRDFHQNPELGNRETRTAGIVAKHLKSLGMQVQTDIAYTGVVGILKRRKAWSYGNATRRYGCTTGNRKNRCAI